MKSGCSGCLVAVVSLGIVALAVGGAVGAGLRMLAKPEAATLPATTAADGTRAQQKIFDLARHRSSQPVILSEAEVNALLSRHLVEARGVRLNTLGVRLLGGDRLELTGQTPLHQLFEEAGLPVVLGVLPSRWRERPLWVHVGAVARVRELRRRASAAAGPGAAAAARSGGARAAPVAAARARRAREHRARARRHPGRFVALT
ncbi:MAG: hypothetical protein DMD78_23025 [Candidatus Rokuibacteriota bacterium]|nr:MAG: hypothetical protein DMD78_23025 [Candidatus Rokubacteria bacterium]